MKIKILVDGTICESLSRIEAEAMAKFFREQRAEIEKKAAKHIAATTLAYHATDWMEIRPV